MIIPKWFRKSRNHLSRALFPIVLSILLGMTLTPSAGHAEDWWPIQVKSYYGKYTPTAKTVGQAAPSLNRPKLEEWHPPQKADSPYTIGVSFPHLKDPYWVAVNYGIIEEAKRLGVGIRLVEAGGYNELDRQINQIHDLASQKVDGIILGSISYEGNDETIASLTGKGTPVVEIINDIHAPNISAKALVSFHEMGYYAGEFVAEDAEKSNLDSVRVLFLPGPKASGWAPETLDGFLTAMEFFPGKVDLVDVLWGDTGREKQSQLIQAALASKKSIDYIVGNAIAAEVAPAILKEQGRTDTTSVVATYITPSLYDKIKKGQVKAAPSDLTVIQGRMAVDMMVRILNGENPGKDFPFRSGPFIPMVTPDRIESYPFEGLFGPRGYTPVFTLLPEQR